MLDSSARPYFCWPSCGFGWKSVTRMPAHSPISPLRFSSSPYVTFSSKTRHSEWPDGWSNLPYELLSGNFCGLNRGSGVLYDRAFRATCTAMLLEVPSWVFTKLVKIVEDHVAFLQRLTNHQFTARGLLDLHASFVRLFHESRSIFHAPPSRH